MFDDTQNVLHRQPTISNRSPLDPRSRRSDAPEAVPDTRPPSTDDPTGRPIRQQSRRPGRLCSTPRVFRTPADEPPQLVHSGPMLSHVQQIAEVKRLLALRPARQDRQRTNVADVSRSTSSS